MQYKDVCKALAIDDAAHAAVMAGFRIQARSGDYQKRWNRADRMAMSRALTAAEDALETSTSKRLARVKAAYGELRRALEDATDDRKPAPQEIPYARVAELVSAGLTPKRRAA